MGTGRLAFAGSALAGAILLGACAGTAPSPDGGSGGLAMETVGNRADLISGGDVLVRVSLPEGAEPLSAVLSVNGQRFSEPQGIGPLAGGPVALGGTKLTGLLKPEPGAKTYLAHVGNLTDGKNTLVLTSGGKSVRLDVTNHPNGGPLFSGPQIQPWACAAGAFDAQCNRGTTYAWSYMPANPAPAAEGRAASPFKPYDPAKPPSDIANINVNGVTLPYIVRTESFTQNRSGVSVAVLYDDRQAPWDAYSPQKQWNKGVLVLQGAGCGTGYGEQPAGSPMNDRALKQGFAVVTVALLHNTINCNPIVQAEAAVMAKEHVAETYGPFDYVFGTGSSGGAISQIMDQNAYPGLYDGLLLNHLFSDSDASRVAAYDCRVVYDAWAKAKEAWTEEQKVAVVGMISGCNASPTRFTIYDPAVGTGCDVADDKKFDPVKNPKGVRCTLQDYEANQVGRRGDGAAFGRLDNVGLQYGLKAVMSGKISPAQFVELNASIGGHDINFKPTPGRTEADRAGLKRLYETGVANTETNLADTPIIETRLSVTDFHQPFHAVMVRARLDRAQGHHDNYALWKTPAGREAKFDDSFDVMVDWIKAIKADTRNVPKAQKVIDNRPAKAQDRCIVEGADASAAACPRPLELTRTLAGAPDTNDTGKCQLKPLKRSDYGSVTFTEAQWAQLQKTFPTGVCDHSKPVVDFAKTTPWLSYLGNGQAKPLGAAPRSH
ncbi:MAG TPA: DUF6351 family protein [Hyphomonadaceae bacterium]|nr:DUF6351 family protein [Hyphomonadaceae bacterium]